jgi:hypothetical protein
VTGDIQRTVETKAVRTWYRIGSKSKAWEDQEELLKNVQGRVEYPTYRKKKEKANWIGHILRRNCLLNDVIEG